MSTKHVDLGPKRLVIDLGTPPSKVSALEAADLVPNTSVRDRSRSHRKRAKSLISRDGRSSSPSPSSGKAKRLKSCVEGGSSRSISRAFSTDSDSGLTKGETADESPESSLPTGLATESNGNQANKESKDAVQVDRSISEEPSVVSSACADAEGAVSGGDVDIDKSHTTSDHEEEGEEEDPVASEDGSSWHPSENQEDEENEVRLRSRRRSVASHHSGTVKDGSNKRLRRSSAQSVDRKNIAEDNEPNRRSSRLKTKAQRKSPESDDYCWICHKVGQMVVCSCCPRVYHSVCLCMDQFPETWLCPECQDLLFAECSLYQSPSWKNVNTKQLQSMLLFLVDRLAMQQWSAHFREPVDQLKVEGYMDVVHFPMDLKTLYSRVKEGLYASAQAFLSDFRWILHNSVVFNGHGSPITADARLLNKACLREIALMRACPTCYLIRMQAVYLLPSTPKVFPILSDSEWLPESIEANKSQSTFSSSTSSPPAPPPLESSSRNTAEREMPEGFDPWWFCRLCDTVHPLVWVRLQNFPLWPAKVLTIDGDSLLVMFFGDYDTTTAPTGSVQFHSEARAKRTCQQRIGQSQSNQAPVLDFIRSPNPVDGDQNGSNAPTPPPPPMSPMSNSSNSSGRTKKTSSFDPSSNPHYRQALTELGYHVDLIRYRYPDFKLLPTSLEFSRRLACRHYKIYRSNNPAGSSEDQQQQQHHQVTQKPPNGINHGSLISTEKPVTSMDLARKSKTGKRTEEVNEKDDNVKRVRSDTYLEPVLTRVAASLRDSSAPLTPSSDERMNSDASVFIPVTTDGSTIQHSLVPESTPLPSSQANKTSSCNPETVAPNKESPLCPHTIPQPALEMAPLEIHPIPEMSDKEPHGMDEVHALLQKFRSQFDEALQGLEEKWKLPRPTPASEGRRSSISREPPVLSPATAESEVQTEGATAVEGPLSKTLTSKMHEENEQSKAVDVGTITPRTSILTPLQAVMMEGEIDRLDRENRRLNLLLAFTRAEMASEMRHRIAELRRVWNFEVSAILEAASKIWEQEVIHIIDAVKRKQWCAYCGRLAYYYCCWNTCYCNSKCQAKHWDTHISSCLQARSHMSSGGGATSSASDGHHHRDPSPRQQMAQQQQIMRPVPIASKVGPVQTSSDALTAIAPAVAARKNRTN
ncbi:unnamed protein product [Calicophoron daubneyi]|uniref:Protein kinase C-binding protein 1 n=1 Tax=Calicophoron daubneyi TaxID=300641 RepID=A0AAV2T9T5_CALDB